MNFKYGDRVKVLSEFYNNAIGVIIDCRRSEYRALNADRNELEYLVRLDYNQTWQLEGNLELDPLKLFFPKVPENTEKIECS